MYQVTVKVVMSELHTGAVGTATYVAAKPFKYYLKLTGPDDSVSVFRIPSAQGIAMLNGGIALDADPDLFLFPSIPDSPETL